MFCVSCADDLGRKAGHLCNGLARACFVRAQMSILVLFSTGVPMTLSEIVDKLANNMSYSVSDKWTLCKHVNAALLSLTAARHAVLLSSKPPCVSSPGLSGVSDSLPFDSDTVFRVNLGFSSTSSVVQLHRVSTAEEEQSAFDRAAMMAFRRSVIEAMVVQAVKGRGHVPIATVATNVRARLADRFEVTDAVRQHARGDGMGSWRSGSRGVREAARGCCWECTLCTSDPCVCAVALHVLAPLGDDRTSRTESRHC